MTGAKAQVLAAIKIHELKLVAIDIEISEDTTVLLRLGVVVRTKFFF